MYGEKPFNNTKLKADLLGSSYPVNDFTKTSGGVFKEVEVNHISAPKDGVTVGFLPGSRYLGFVGIGGNKTTAPNKKAGTYLIDLLDHHTDAYIRDEESMNFLYPINTNDKERNEDNKKQRDDIKVLHNQIWNQFEPVQFNKLYP